MQPLSYYDSRLRAHADSQLSKKRTLALKVLRGFRGAPARLIAELLEEDPYVELPQGEEELHRLFMRAHEDGMIAIGLLSVAALSQAQEAYELAQEWLELIDDVETADALGWTVLGPIALQLSLSPLEGYRHASGVYAKRAWVMSLLAAIPEPPKGAHVAGLRAHLQSEQVIFVDEPVLPVLQEAFPVLIKEEHPTLRKAVVALIRSWASASPEGIEAVIDLSKGNLPRWIREPYERGARRHKRSQQRKKD